MRRALRWWLAVSTAVACTLVGCSQTPIAQRVRAAAQSQAMPQVVACWEQAFETAGFRGKYLATVDFVVQADGSLRDVSVVSFVDQQSSREVSGSDDAGALRTCLHDALTETRLTTMDLDEDLAVVGYRIAFDDGSERAREQAAERTPHLLIGPRADRCAGLYAHEPPRDVARLQGELDQAREDAEAARGVDHDRLARALQHQYDVSLELAERLRIASEEPSLTRQARQRYLAELKRARHTATTVGASIGCRPPVAAGFR